MAGLVIWGGGRHTTVRGPKGLCWLTGSRCGDFPSHLELIEAEGEVQDLGELLGQGLLPLQVLGRGVGGAREGLQQAPQGVLCGQSTPGPPLHLPTRRGETEARLGIPSCAHTPRPGLPQPVPFLPAGRDAGCTAGDAGEVRRSPSRRENS